MNIGDVVAILFWPLMAVAAAVCWKYRASENVSIALPIILAFLVLPPFLIVWVMLGTAH